MAKLGGHEPISAEDALKLLERHWSARVLPLLDLLGVGIERFGFPAAAEAYFRLVDPVWNWLCDEQARFLDRVRGRGDEGDSPDFPWLVASGVGLAAIAASIPNRSLFL